MHTRSASTTAIAMQPRRVASAAVPRGAVARAGRAITPLCLVAVALAGVAPPTGARGAPRRTPVVEAVELAAPAIVAISAEVRTRSPFRGGLDDLFGWGDEFFGPRERRAATVGSGVLIDGRGYIVTNQHVVAGAAQVKVQLADRREFVAAVVGADARFDIAVLKVESRTPLPAVKVGTARDLMPGETVIAIGNPFGLSHTVSTGVVSAIHRVVPISKERTCEDCIQTDAAINPGNSGGALLNINGELIGINAAIRANANSIGFAIPVDRARAIVDDLLRFGQVRYGWLGITPRDAPRLGVAVAAVEHGSPAHRGGIKTGDVILALNDQPLRRAQDFLDRTAQTLAGDELTLRLARGPVKVKAGWLPPAEATRRAQQRVGLEVAVRVDQTDGTRGLQIIKVAPKGVAAAAGIRAGDWLRGVNHRALRAPADFLAVLAALRPGADAVFAIQRGPYVWYVPLQL
jgi:serine protease Do